MGYNRDTIRMEGNMKVHIFHQPDVPLCGARGRGFLPGILARPSDTGRYDTEAIKRRVNSQLAWCKRCWRIIGGTK